MRSELRARMREARIALSDQEQERARLSAKIWENAWPLMEDAESALLYASDFGEVETRALAERFLKQGAAVYYPRVLGAGRMEAVRVRALSELRPGHMGILEPVGEECAPEMDVYVVPGLAYSPEGTRLGFGKGYYDRFLAGKRGSFVALAYSFQIVDGLSAQAHDVPVHWVVTENAIYDCNKGDL